jgi:sigma-B regulation protein RsbU (phosphoserine phosphatase)
MLQRSARLQYVLLAVVTFFALTHFYMGVAGSFANLSHGHLSARAPFFQGALGPAVRLTTPEAMEAGRRPGDTAVTITLAQPEARAAGLQVGDAVLNVNSRPFSGGIVLLDELRKGRPGQPMSLTVLRPDGSEETITFPLAAVRPSAPPVWVWVIQCVFVLLPFLCMLVGLYTVFARPRNLHMRFILGVLLFACAGHSAEPALVHLSNRADLEHRCSDAMPIASAFLASTS